MVSAWLTSSTFLEERKNTTGEKTKKAFHLLLFPTPGEKHQSYSSILCIKWSLVAETNVEELGQSPWWVTAPLWWLLPPQHVCMTISQSLQPPRVTRHLKVFLLSTFIGNKPEPSAAVPWQENNWELMDLKNSAQKKHFSFQLSQMIHWCLIRNN